jgi:hypothetical protein
MFNLRGHCRSLGKATTATIAYFRKTASAPRNDGKIRLD